MKKFTFIELSSNNYFGKIEIFTKTKKEAVLELIKKASEVQFYKIEFSSKKVNELFGLI